MKTKDVVEHLLFSDKHYSSLFNLIGVIDKNRMWGSSKHIELNNVLSNFESSNLEFVKVVMVCGIIQKIVIFDSNPDNRIKRCLPCIVIQGHESSIENWSKTKALTEFNSVLNLKDFLPKPFSRKIIYISNLKKIKPIVFSEYTKNEWTLEDPMILATNKNTSKMSPKIIIKNILNDFI